MDNRLQVFSKIDLNLIAETNLRAKAGTWLKASQKKTAIRAGGKGCVVLLYCKNGLSYCKKLLYCKKFSYYSNPLLYCKNPFMTYKKAGRPKLSNELRRGRVVTLRLTESEYGTVVLTTPADSNPSAWIRQVLFEGLERNPVSGIR